MELTLRHIGGFGHRPSPIIELTVRCNGAEIVSDVTNLSGEVDKNLIHSLRNIADELEEQNLKVSEGKEE
jgi:hypothetical protein